MSGDEGDIPTTLVQPIGLLINELVTNAAKHGRGLVEMLYEIEASRHTLIVSDKGRDLPKNFDPAAASKSLGMRVVTSLLNNSATR